MKSLHYVFVMAYFWCLIACIVYTGLFCAKGTFYFFARISQMVEKLCIDYGEKIADVDGQTYYDFPTIEALSCE